MDKKITKRENFETIVTVLEGADRTDLADVIRHEIGLLDKKAAKAKAAQAKKKTEGDALTEAVEAALTDELCTIGDITARVVFDGEVTASKVQYRLNQLLGFGKARKEQIVVGEDKAKRVAYALPVVDED